MAQGDTVDNLIRAALSAEVSRQEPAPAVREALLATAARENVVRSALGPPIPPVADALCEDASQPQLDAEPSGFILSSPWSRRQLLWLATPLYAVR